MPIISIHMTEAQAKRLEQMAGHRGRSMLVAKLVDLAHDAVSEHRHEHSTPINLQEPDAPDLRIRAVRPTNRRKA